jgi:hypothetical protein
MLRDAAMLPGHNAGLTEIVQEAGLPVVNVAHDGHNGRPGHQHTRVRRRRFNSILFKVRYLYNFYNNGSLLLRNQMLENYPILNY